MTGHIPSGVVAAVMGDAQQPIRRELQRCRETIDSLKQACREKTKHFERASILTQIAHQLLEFELRVSPQFAATEALTTVLAQIDTSMTSGAICDVHSAA